MGFLAEFPQVYCTFENIHKKCWREKEWESWGRGGVTAGPGVQWHPSNQGTRGLTSSPACCGSESTQWGAQNWEDFLILQRTSDSTMTGQVMSTWR